MSAERSASRLEVGRPRDGPSRSGRRSRRAGAVPIRQGIVLPHASSAQKRVSSRARSTMQARSSATTTEPEPMWAPAVAQRLERRTACRARSAGRMPPDGPPTRTALIFRPRRRLPPSATMSRSGVPSGTSATPAPPGARTWTRIVPGLVLRADRRERLGAVARGSTARRRGSGRSGRPSACRTGRARPGAAAAARAGRACPRGPSAGPSPRRACRRPGPAGR